MCPQRGRVRFGGDRGREPYTALTQHPAIFWHFCGNFSMSRGALQKMLRRSRYEKRTKQIFCTRSEKWSENRSSRFQPKILLVSFSRVSGPPLRFRPNWIPVRINVVSNKPHSKNVLTHLLRSAVGTFGRDCYSLFPSL